MKVFLVDDSKIDLVKLQHFIEQYASELGIEMETSLFSTVDEFLEAYAAEEKKPYLIFMDILYSEGSDGIAAATKMRELGGKSSRLIFTTSSQEYILDAFDVYADGYLTKPYRYEDFKRALARLESRFRNESRVITLKAVRQDIPLHVGQIMYVETADHKVDIHTEDDCITANMAMKDIDAMLDGENGFIHCGQSFIINMVHVKEVTRESITMNDGMQIVIPVRLRKAISDQVKAFRAKLPQ